MSEETLKSVLEVLKSINRKLDAQLITNTLKAEDKTYVTEDIKTETEKKVDLAQKYNYMSKKGTPYTCNKCKGFISWDLRPERSFPLHVNQEGRIVNDGNCPEYSP